MNVLNLVTNSHAQFFEQQVETLTTLGVRGRTVAVPGSRRNGDETSTSRSPFDYLRFYPRVLGEVVDGGYDVVHANYGLTGPAALAQPTRPVVLSLWGSDLLGRYGPLSKLCARAADAVIVMSDEMATALDPVDSHVVPHGVDLELFRPLPQAAARRQVGWDEAPAQVLFPYATDRSVKDHPRAAGVVGTASEHLEGEVELQTLHGVAHEMMPLYLNAADVLLLTSKHEGSPNSVKEAMACNLPVVATDVGDLSQLLGDVTPSRVCRTDEEIVAGLVDVLGTREASDGRAHVGPYGLGRMGERIRGVYEGVL